MPILNVKVSGAESEKLRGEIIGLLMELTGRILNKKAEDTAIALEFVDPANWFVDGRSLEEQGKASFFFDIKITDETNSKAEKAAYIREAFAGFGHLLGSLHEKSYIHVQDVRATAYGYGGETQEFRYHR